LGLPMLHVLPSPFSLQSCSVPQRLPAASLGSSAYIWSTRLSSRYSSWLSWHHAPGRIICAFLRRAALHCALCVAHERAYCRMIRGSMMRLLAIFFALLVTACTGGKGDPEVSVDAAPTLDADPSCQVLDSVGGFPDCALCDEIGSGCDTIDVSGQVSRVCDCSAPCPCELRCGDIEIAPGVVVGNVCVR
jgi:hypothetical protein